MPETIYNKIVLFEYDKPIDRNELLNLEAGIWFWKTKNTVATVQDDHLIDGYYQYYQALITYNIKSLKVAGANYSSVSSLADCRITDKSFYYDTTSTKLYIHFVDFGTPDGKDIFFGSAVGYSKMPNNEDGCYFNDVYYESRLLSVSGLKKSIDPLFFGVLKYSSGSVKLINTDGKFKSWRSENLWGQACRTMVGNVGSDYSTFLTTYEGFIKDDSRTFKDFTVKIEDKREALTQPIASNLLQIADYPYLSDGNIDKPKPVAYGTVKNAKAICLNEEESAPTNRTFLICDTEFNNVSSLTTIYVDGVSTGITGTTDLTAGTFTMTTVSVADNEDNITIDFVATSFDNGVEIIKYLMLNYDGKTFLASFWDLTEVNAAVLLARDTSLYIDSGSKKLRDGLQSVASDIDARFFVKNDGVYTIRIFNEDRTPNTKRIENDEYENDPKIVNNGSEYLSSVIIEYNHDLENDKYLTYENTGFKQEVFDTYKKYKVETFTTNLINLADATDKSNTIMNISKSVKDEISRSVFWSNFGIEPSDFIEASPETRLTDEDDFNIYEVLSVKNDQNKFIIDLTLREVKKADAENTYDTIDDNTDDRITDNNDLELIGRIT